MIDKIDVTDAVGSILIAIGEDPKREGLQDTPTRVAKFWEEFINYDPGQVDVTFEAVSADQMIVLQGLRVYSMCEHHLLPMICDVSIGYISGPRVLGLSKLARIAQKHAHKLQLQERLTEEIADEVSEMANTPDVVVLIEGTHLCMQMRGIRTEGTVLTCDERGRFRTKPQVRAEFFQLIRRRK